MGGYVGIQPEALEGLAHQLVHAGEELVSIQRQIDAALATVGQTGPRQPGEIGRWAIDTAPDLRERATLIRHGPNAPTAGDRAVTMIGAPSGAGTNGGTPMAAVLAELTHAVHDAAAAVHLFNRLGVQATCRVASELIDDRHHWSMMCKALANALDSERPKLHHAFTNALTKGQGLSAHPLAQLGPCSIGTPIEPRTQGREKDSLGKQGLGEPLYAQMPLACEAEKHHDAPVVVPLEGGGVAIGHVVFDAADEENGGGAQGGTNADSKSEPLDDGWRGVTMGDRRSFEYHYAKHNEGRTPEQYAEDARAWATNPNGTPKPVGLQDGTVGTVYRTPGGGPGGILDSDGNIISFWYH